MKLVAIALGLCAMSLSACGVSTTTSSSFKVRMHGTYSPPPGADGTSAPRSQVYLLSGVTLTKSDGTELPLMEGDPKSVKIIDRGQILFEKADTSEYDDTAISSVKITFDPTVLITSKDNVTSSLELSSGDMVLNEGFTITKNKARVVTIKAAWGDTITPNGDGTETVSPPSFTISYDDGD